MNSLLLPFHISYSKYYGLALADKPAVEMIEPDIEEGVTWCLTSGLMRVSVCCTAPAPAAPAAQCSDIPDINDAELSVV